MAFRFFFFFFAKNFSLGAPDVIHWISLISADKKGRKSLRSPLIYEKSKSVSIIKYVALQKNWTNVQVKLLLG